MSARAAKRSKAAQEAAPEGAASVAQPIEQNAPAAAPAAQGASADISKLTEGMNTPPAEVRAADAAAAFADARIAAVSDGAPSASAAPKSDAERMKAYRERKKAERAQGATSGAEVQDTPAATKTAPRRALKKEEMARRLDDAERELERLRGAGPSPAAVAAGQQVLGTGLMLLSGFLASKVDPELALTEAEIAAIVPHGGIPMADLLAKIGGDSPWTPLAVVIVATMAPKVVNVMQRQAASALSNRAGTAEVSAHVPGTPVVPGVVGTK